MAHFFPLSILLLPVVWSPVLGITCPGVAGYCSASYPGHVCNVVCSRGRPVVPVCQKDGTWTAHPRCIEHEPGKEEQVAGGICIGVPGYCSLSFAGNQCHFKCHRGPPIDSVCKQDGTWEPYPTCQGDVRDTQDGCSHCPGPNGRFRNRTAEAILGNTPSSKSNEIPQDRVPKAGFINHKSKTRSRIGGSHPKIKISTTNSNKEKSPSQQSATHQGVQPKSVNFHPINKIHSKTTTQPTPAPQTRPSFQPRHNPQTKTTGKPFTKHESLIVSPNSTPTSTKGQETFGIFPAVDLSNPEAGVFDEPRVPRIQHERNNDRFYGVFEEVKLKR